jgi:hypothetical protein
LKALEGVDFASGTIERYKTSYKHTEDFINWKYGTLDLCIVDLEYEFMSDYAFWLKSIRKCNHNTTMKYLANFKKIVLICVKNKWLPSDPFNNFKLTKRIVDRKTKDRAANLATKYAGVAEIMVGITKSTTFEKDLIDANTIHKGRDILLKVIREVRPNSGKAYADGLDKGPIVTDDFFALLEKHKSEFAYSLLLQLSEDSEGFNIPTYITAGINFLA